MGFKLEGERFVMHDYLWMFKDSKTVKKLHNLRENHDICFYKGTLGKPLNRLKGESLASIQLYEYILYDFILNENIINSMNLEERRCFHFIYQAVKNNMLTKKNEQKRLSKELETVNFKISTIVDHEKYCKLYSQAKTPDYLSAFKDQDVTKYLNYIRLQNGINIHEGTAKIPWLMDNLPVNSDVKASMQLYEYILYDYLLNTSFHSGLSIKEEKSAMNVLNALANNGFGLTKDIYQELAIDINTTNNCIGRTINNQKFFKLYSESTVCPEEERMNFLYRDIHLYIKPMREEYQKKKQLPTTIAS